MKRIRAMLNRLTSYLTYDLQFGELITFWLLVALLISLPWGSR
jgi:hypothetical protein